MSIVLRSTSLPTGAGIIIDNAEIARSKKETASIKDLQMIVTKGRQGEQAYILYPFLDDFIPNKETFPPKEPVSW